MKIRLTIDRFEGETTPVAVLLSDDGRSLSFPRAFLPRGAKPGDVLSVTIEKDPGATRRVARQTRKVQDQLKATDPGGDIKL